MFVFLERWQTVSFRNEKARNTTSDKHETACTSAYIIERQVINVRINGSWEEGGEKKKKRNAHLLNYYYSWPRLFLKKRKNLDLRKCPMQEAANKIVANGHFLPHGAY